MLRCGWFFLLTLSVHAAEPGAEALIRQAGLPPGSVSLWVSNPQGQAAMTWLPEVPRKLGSVMKLVTTLVALERLGPERRFPTDLLAVPDSSPNRWRVFFRGGGDIEFKYEDLQTLLEQAKEKGLSRIVSPITVDLRRFSDQKAKTTGISLTPQRASGLEPSALSLNFGLIEMSANPSGTWALSPPFSLVTKTDHSGPCADTGLDEIELKPDLRHQRFHIVPENRRPCGAVQIRRAPLDQLTQLKWAFTSLWPEAAQHQWVVGAAPSYAPIALRHESPPLKEWVRDINTFSNNVAARTLLLQLAAEEGYLPATAEDGVRLVRQWIKDRQWSFPEFSMENGAGLSQLEILSAQHLAEILKYALTSPYAPDYMESMAVPGREGTLRSRLETLPRADQWRLKTGRLDDVRTLAGYYKGRSGPWVVVCLVNDPTPDRAMKLQELLLNYIESKDFDTN